MSLLSFLFKPKWQNKDAAVRREAVIGSQEAELVAALPQLLRDDPDAGVRLAALRRLDEYELWRERSTADAAGEVRTAARAAYLQRLVNGAGGMPALERRVAELDTLSGEELEQVLTGAKDTGLRAAALEKVRRPALLVERAVADPDPALRQIALTRINDLDALARVAERTRKTDKTVSRLAREKLEALRIAAGDADAIALRARALVERAEALLQRARGDRAEELDAIEKARNEIAATAPAALRERLDATLSFLRSDTDEVALQRGALRALRQRIDAMLAQLERSDAAAIEPLLAEATAALVGAPQELPERGPIEDGVTRMMRHLAGLAAHTQTAPAAEAIPQAGSVEAVAAQARFDATLAAAQAETQRERERQAQRRRHVETDVVELEKLLEAGDISAAHAVHARIEAELAGLPPTAHHDKRLINAQTRYAELKRWQHWSNNEQRKRLCDAVEALLGSGLHPDAVATRVREVRAEWQQLDASEGIAAPAKGERPTQGLGRRFQALCNEALKPARGYFDKRSELRKSHEQEMSQLLERVAAIGADADRAAWSAPRAELAAALRGLGDVDPRQRKALAQQLKDALTRIDGRLDAFNAAVVEAKRALIGKAERAAQNPDRIAAARELRDLQKQWKEAGNARRKDDDALWKSFRGICDKVFGDLDAQRREQTQRETEAQAEAERIVAALEALADASADQVRAQRRELSARWAELACKDRALFKRWQNAEESLDARQAQAQRRERNAAFEIAYQRLQRCERIEQDGPSAEAGPEWNSLPDVTGELGMALQARFDAAIAGAPTHLAENDIGAARDILVQLEFHGGCESPAEDRQRRMDWQVSRLSQRMGRGAAPAPREELLDLLVQWVSLGGLTGDEAAALRARFDKVWHTALERLP
jgi:hypothetical protein